MNILKVILYIAVIILNIVKAIYIIKNSKDRTHSVDLLISGAFIGVFVMMMVELWS